MTKLAELLDWLRRNRPDLYQRVYQAPTRDDMRIILNKETGLCVRCIEPVQKGSALFLERLKEIAVTPPPGCVDNRTKEIQRERTD